MRPDWTDALRMSRSVLPHRSLTSVDQRLADANRAVSNDLLEDRPTRSGTGKQKAQRELGFWWTLGEVTTTRNAR
jgi:hypothetical protein